MGCMYVLEPAKLRDAEKKERGLDLLTLDQVVARDEFMHRDIPLFCTKL